MKNKREVEHIRKQLKDLKKELAPTVNIKRMIIFFSKNKPLYNQFFIYLILSLIIPVYGSGQSYTSYFTGNSADMVSNPFGGICIMGGATEDDEAMKWFLQRANGGDILVLRTSGSNGYNSYLYSDLGVLVNSVETIVFNNPSASTDPYIHQKIQQAEAIWFAGGDQWNYVSYWRNTAIDSLINEGITSRNIAIGGTSAGMAIQGGFYFSAQNGTVTSPMALSDPYNSKVTVDSLSFLDNDILDDVITDTHYDDPDRKGRHIVFLARILTDYGIPAKGIACDEYTAVCIDTNGIASVYGQYPSYDDNAYFIQTNCELPDILPENCSSGNPLTWNLSDQAIKVYTVKGTSDGANTFNLMDWETGTGGSWENWFIDNGQLIEQPGSQIDCSPLSILPSVPRLTIRLHPNPASNSVTLTCDNCETSDYSIEFVNVLGLVVKKIQNNLSNQVFVKIDNLAKGLYYLHYNMDKKVRLNTILVVE